MWECFLYATVIKIVPWVPHSRFPLCSLSASCLLQWHWCYSKEGEGQGIFLVSQGRDLSCEVGTCDQGTQGRIQVSYPHDTDGETKPRNEVFLHCWLLMTEILLVLVQAGATRSPNCQQAWEETAVSQTPGYMLWQKWCSRLSLVLLQCSLWKAIPELLSSCGYKSFCGSQPAFIHD